MPDIQTAVIDTEALPCDGQIRSQWWVAPADITIRRLEYHPLSDGAPAGAVFPAVDLHTTIRMSGGRVLLAQALDHYAAWTADPVRDKVFSDAEAPRLAAGEHLSIAHLCSPQFGCVSHSRYLLIVTYTVDGA